MAADNPMVLMNDFRAEPAEVRDAMLESVRRVLASGWYVLGNEVLAFEREWARLCGVGFAVGVGNGMDAIEIALRALDIGPGDEVITTPMTAFATVLAIVRSGAIPALADIDADTALLSTASVRRCITKRTRAVVLVHLYGQVRQMDEWVALCAEHGIQLIEDCAQSHLAVWNGKPAGSFGIAGTYSFYPTKNLGAAGDAGALVTRDEPVALRAARLRNYGQSVRYHHPELGLNSRLDEIHAAMLSVRLKWLPDFTARRRAIANTYRLGIANSAISLLTAPQEDSAHVHHLFVVLSERRGDLQRHLESCGIQSLIHYPVPVHHQEPFQDIQRDPAGLSCSELHAKTCLSLPCHPQLSDQDLDRVISAVNSFPG
jgi:dTDP-4-amino-4,6-dideoxygalactose transaminase